MPTREATSRAGPAFGLPADVGFKAVVRQLATLLPLWTHRLARAQRSLDQA